MGLARLRLYTAVPTEWAFQVLAFWHTVLTPCNIKNTNDQEIGSIQEGSLFFTEVTVLDTGWLTNSVWMLFANISFKPAVS